MLRARWSNIKIKLYQRCLYVVSTSDTDVVSTLCNVENSTSDFVSFSTSDQRYFNVDPQRWFDVEMLAGVYRLCYSLYEMEWWGIISWLKMGNQFFIDTQERLFPGTWHPSKPKILYSHTVRTQMNAKMSVGLNNRNDSNISISN